MSGAALAPTFQEPTLLGWFTTGRQPTGSQGKVHGVKQVAATVSGAGPTDAALVIAARGGEDWAFEALFRRHANLVFGLAYRLLPRDADVDDVVQDVFSAAFERLGTLQNPQAYAAWLGSIVVNTVSKRIRRRRLLERLGLRSAEPYDPDQVVSPVAPVEASLELKAIYRVLERLPTEERVALVLRRVEGMEVAQIAVTMGLSVSTVKRRLTAAEARLERARQR
jgi:RNA polymerase sigma-70 factor (ECF subfamily)